MKNFIKEIEKINDNDMLKTTEIMKIPVVQDMRVFPYIEALYRCVKNGLLVSTVNTSSGEKRKIYLISGRDLKKFLKSRIENK